MAEASGEPTSPGRTAGPQLTVLTCPHCKSRYEPRNQTRGRRVRCRVCNHVWRDERDTSEAVAGALQGAAENWLRIGSTLEARADHASTLAAAVHDLGKNDKPLASDWVGKKLGRYEIKSILGEGAMGFVYEANDEELRRLVAIKILPRPVQDGHEPLGLKMFLQEARAAAKLQHPNAVTVYDIGRENGTYYFSMDRILGVTLARLIEEHGAIPPSQCCYIVANAARALAAGHALGIVHRDVKPSNIMIDTSGFVKMTDFGLADIQGIDGVPEMSSRPLGTPGWMSPEAARGEKATAASDIYSLGLVLYNALTGKRLIRAKSRSGLVRAHAAAQSVTRESLPDAWAPRLRDIVVQCLQADPNDRYKSAETLAAELLRALMPGDEDGTVMLADERLKKKRIVPVFVSSFFLTLLVLVAGVLAAWWWWFMK